MRTERQPGPYRRHRLAHGIPDPTAQRLDGRDVRAHAAMSGRIRLVRTGWMIPVDGPLGYLTGRMPLVSVALDDMRLTFGQAP